MPFRGRTATVVESEGRTKVDETSSKEKMRKLEMLIVEMFMLVMILVAVNKLLERLGWIIRVEARESCVAALHERNRSESR